MLTLLENSLSHFQKLSWSPTTTKTQRRENPPSLHRRHSSGGLTRVLAIDRSISFTGLCAFPFSDSIFVNSFGFLWTINQKCFFFLLVVTELMVTLGEFCGSSVNLRCQLPTSDLETLISITSDDRLRRDGRRSYLRQRPAVDSQSFRLRPFVQLQVSLSLSLSLCLFSKKKNWIWKLPSRTLQRIFWYSLLFSLSHSLHWYFSSSPII